MRIRWPDGGCPISLCGTAEPTRRVAELARSGRPLLIDLTEDAVVATVTSDVAERITVAAGSPVGDVSATA